MKKQISILLFLFILSLNNKAQDFVWAKSMGSANNDRGRSLKVDAFGNVYVTGSFVGVVDFDSGPGTATVEAVGITGNNNVFIAKYDKNGNYLWVKNIGGHNYEAGYSLELDQNSNIYITGYFKDTVDFDPGVASATISAGSNNGDVFLAKYDNAGNYVWANRISGNGTAGVYGSVYPSNLGRTIKVDAFGNVFLTGYFDGTADFDPGPGTAIVTTCRSIYLDVFLVKYSSIGSFLWVKRISSTGDDVASNQAIDLDNFGNVYLIGSCKDTVSFDQSVPTLTAASQTGSFFFIAKYSPNGNLLWSKYSQGSSLSYAAAHALKLDKFNNIYIAGVFYDNIDLDFGVNTSTFITQGGQDLFYAKYDNNGNHIWSKSLTGAQDHFGKIFHITVDSENLYMIGDSYSETDFDPSVNTTTVFSAAPVIYLAKYDDAGNYLWVKSISPPGTDDYGACIELDLEGSAYCTGYFNNSNSDFDFGPGTQTLNCVGTSVDIFLVKYSKVAVGLNEQLLESTNLTIYPNPSADKFNLKGNKDHITLKIEVSDVIGKQILTKFSNEESTTIDILNSPKGIYFVKVFQAGILISVKKICIE